MAIIEFRDKNLHKKLARRVLRTVLSDHGYADSETYGKCFCGEVYEDILDMAEHQIDKLREAGLDV